MSHELIDLTKWPSMPAPWSSTDPGQAWVWGDYVATLQTNPALMGVILNKIAGKKVSDQLPLEFLFAMTVFYRQDKNPHGPSHRPILVATLERMNYGALDDLAGSLFKGLALGTDSSGSSPVVQGLFTAETRLNLGDFQGPLTRATARRYFLELIRDRLSLEGEPEEIGKISDVYGHPKTGWPRQERNKSVGCLIPIVAAMAFPFLPTLCSRFLI